MKIYCFIKDKEIGIYDKADWSKSKVKIYLRDSLGHKVAQEFIDYVATHCAPKENSLLKNYPATYMYEIDL